MADHMDSGTRGVKVFLTMPARSPDADQALAVVLRRLREERGETQEDLGYQVRLTAGSLSRIEQGQANPAWSTVRKIAEGLGVTLAELAKAVEQEEDHASGRRTSTTAMPRGNKISNER
jgi:transcriptional regulator with XRE-family HTH domain